MRLALIAPPNDYLAHARSWPPLGLGHLSAYVKREMPDVSVDMIILKAGEKAPGGYDVYGFSASTHDYRAARDLAWDIKQREPKAVCILGGGHATVMAGRTSLVFDKVVMGEGEVSLVRCLRDIQRRAVRRFYTSDPIADLDSLPFPDRHFGDEFKYATVMASRGCPYHCSYCATQTIWPGPTRWRSPGNAVAEIADLKAHGVDYVSMIDDSLTVRRDWLTAFCEAIKPVGMKWRALSRVDRIDPEILARMRDAGCDMIKLGAESFDPAVLKAMGKGTTPEQGMKAAEDVYDAGLTLWLLLMISTPGETLATVPLNETALERLCGKVSVSSLHTFMPMPATPVYHKPKDYGIKIIDKDVSHYNRLWWGSEGKQNPPWSPIEIDGLTRRQQMENIARMRDCVTRLGSPSKGLA